MSETPMIYDCGVDAFRPVTQQDVDRLVAITKEYYDFRCELSSQLVLARSRVLAIEDRPPVQS